MLEESKITRMPGVRQAADVLTFNGITLEVPPPKKKKTWA
jgi:hypothetical protein